VNIFFEVLGQLFLPKPSSHHDSATAKNQDPGVAVVFEKLLNKRHAPALKFVLMLETLSLPVALR
jgi:hypothetical protein